jgi:hypothetical protein
MARRSKGGVTLAAGKGQRLLRRIDGRGTDAAAPA